MQLHLCPSSVSTIHVYTYRVFHHFCSAKQCKCFISSSLICHSLDFSRQSILRRSPTSYTTILAFLWYLWFFVVRCIQQTRICIAELCVSVCCLIIRPHYPCIHTNTYVCILALLKKCDFLAIGKFFAISFENLHWNIIPGVDPRISVQNSF